MTLTQAANSDYALVVAVTLVHILSRRALSRPTADAVTALAIGLAMGALHGFWVGAARTAAMAASIFVLYFVIGVATALWRICRGSSPRS